MLKTDWRSRNVHQRLTNHDAACLHLCLSLPILWMCLYCL